MLSTVSQPSKACTTYQLLLPNDDKPSAPCTPDGLRSLNSRNTGIDFVSFLHHLFLIPGFVGAHLGVPRPVLIGSGRRNIHNFGRRGPELPLNGVSEAHYA